MGYGIHTFDLSKEEGPLLPIKPDPDQGYNRPGKFGLTTNEGTVNTKPFISPSDLAREMRIYMENRMGKQMNEINEAIKCLGYLFGEGSWNGEESYIKSGLEGIKKSGATVPPHRTTKVAHERTPFFGEHTEELPTGGQERPNLKEMRSRSRRHLDKGEPLDTYADDFHREIEKPPPGAKTPVSRWPKSLKYSDIK